MCKTSASLQKRWRRAEVVRRSRFGTGLLHNDETYDVGMVDVEREKKVKNFVGGVQEQAPGAARARSQFLCSPADAVMDVVEEDIAPCAKG